MATRTFTTYFAPELVDQHVGQAFKALESDYLRRKEYIDQDVRLAIEARLDLLRRTWQLMLDRVPD